MDLEKLESKIIELGFIYIYAWGNGEWNGNEGKTFKRTDKSGIFAYINDKGHVWFQYGTKHTSDLYELTKVFTRLLNCALDSSSNDNGGAMCSTA